MKKYIIILITLTFLLYSCQKEISLESVLSQTPTPTPVLTDTVLLKKFILFDTTLTAPSDTLQIINYQYDNLNRCTKIISKGFGGGAVGLDFVDILYNSNDTLIKSLKIYSSYSSDSSKEFFSYNATGKMITDSLVEYTGATISETYNYDFSQINSTNFSYVRKNSLQYAKVKHNIQRDLSGNIINERDTSFLFNSANNSYELSLTNFQTINYDTKKCPFYKFSPEFPIGFIVEGGNFGGSQSIYFGLSKHRNNITREVITILTPISGFAEYDDSYQYIYNLSNYPISVIIKDNTQNNYFKGKYFY